jgi:beta-1,4-N-acetylglucosaminyltransferase
VKVALVCSSGGHLDQLNQLEPWWSTHERFWVSFDTPDAVDLLKSERAFWAHRPTTRNVANAIRNLFLAWKLLSSERPDVVVSDGAGVAVPFFVCAKALGIRTAYIEVYDRIDSRTLTARLCRPFTDLFCVQWPEQLRLYPRSHLIGTLL